MHALVEAGCEDRLRRDDVERFKTGDPREQIEVGEVESVDVCNPVGDGDDDAANRIEDRFSDQLFAEEMLVARARLPHAALVGGERGGEKPRLLPQPFGAAIDIADIADIATGAERLHDERLEPLDLLRLAAKLIVEPHHLRHETRA